MESLQAILYQKQSTGMTPVMPVLRDNSPSELSGVFVKPYLPSREGLKGGYNLPLKQVSKKSDQVEKELSVCEFNWDGILTSSTVGCGSGMLIFNTKNYLYEVPSIKDLTKRPSKTFSSFTPFGLFSKQAYELHRKFCVVIQDAKELNFNEIVRDLESAPSLQSKESKEWFKKKLSEYIAEESLDKAKKFLRIALYLFPMSMHFRRAKLILSPSKIIKIETSKEDSIKATIDFLKKSGKNFQSKWIAVYKGKLVGVSEKYEELMNSIGEKDAVVIKVS